MMVIKSMTTKRNSAHTAKRKEWLDAERLNTHEKALRPNRCLGC